MHYNSVRMRAKAILAAALLISSGVCLGQSAPPKPTSPNAQVTVTELPPEAIPAGTCKDSYSGYLEITEGDKVKNKSFTAQQIGDYVNKRLGEGYSLSLYPQASGRLFVIESCQSAKH